MAKNKKKNPRNVPPKKAAAPAAPEKKRSFALPIACAALAVLLLAGVLIWRGAAKKRADASGDLTPTARAEITVKDYGKIELELYGGVAPLTVDNFVTLAKDGFYDGLTFHRIMEGFMIQGGDPSHDGTGGSKHTIKGEFSLNGVENPLSHVRGTVSMARRSLPYDSASSQFFIVQEDSTFLDGSYAAFGRVTGGMDVVDAIARDAEPIDENGTIPYEAQPVIESVVITD